MLLSSRSHQVSMTNFLFIGFYLSLGEATVWKEAITLSVELNSVIYSIAKLLNTVLLEQNH